MNKPKGPIKYVITRGKIKSILLIPSLCESLTIHPPVKRFIETKCIQNIIKKLLLVNRSDNDSIPM